MEKIIKSKKTIKLKKVSPAPIKRERYFEAVGRRKTAIARVRLFSKKGEANDKEYSILINGKNYQAYFPTLRFQKNVIAPLEKMNVIDKLRAVIKVRGGGIMAQSEAIRLGIARALLEFNATFRKRLKRVGFLARDARMVERKKYGLKKARRAPQWKKR